MHTKGIIKVQTFGVERAEQLAPHCATVPAPDREHDSGLAALLVHGQAVGGHHAVDHLHGGLHPGDEFAVVRLGTVRGRVVHDGDETSSLLTCSDD